MEGPDECVVSQEGDGAGAECSEGVGSLQDPVEVLRVRHGHAVPADDLPAGGAVEVQRQLVLACSKEEGAGV